jgi:hypothetical protein
VTRNEIAWRRLRNERLIGPPFASSVEAVRALGAVQAQDYAGARWALGQRVRAVTDADVEAVFDRGDLLRTHVMRPTWHAVTPADIRWLQALTAPRVKALMAYYDRQLALDASTLARTHRVLARALEGGHHHTRAELAEALAQAGVEASGQRLGHIVMHAELDAVVCSGPRRGKQFTYALLDERAPATRALARDEALAELVRRYFTSHGPAQLVDFAWWSGLTVADAKASIAALSPALQEVAVDGKRYWYAPGKAPARPAAPLVHLLPNYDEFLIAYKDHSASVDRELTRGIGPRDAVFANHIVVLDGQVIGGWRRTERTSKGKPSIAVAFKLLKRLARAEKAALDEALERYRRFTGAPVTVT